MVGVSGVGASQQHLSQQGLRVALVEARDISHGATGRNAGFILQGTVGRYGRHWQWDGKGTFGHHLSVENHRLMREWIETHSSVVNTENFTTTSSPRRARTIESADHLRWI